jgi:hypothetical protein
LSSVHRPRCRSAGVLATALESRNLHSIWDSAIIENTASESILNKRIKKRGV